MEDATDVSVLRIVVREGFTANLGLSLIDDLKSAAAHLADNPPLRSAERSGFSH